MRNSYGLHLRIWRLPVALYAVPYVGFSRHVHLLTLHADFSPNYFLPYIEQFAHGECVQCRNENRAFSTASKRPPMYAVCCYFRMHLMRADCSSNMFCPRSLMHCHCTGPQFWYNYDPCQTVSNLEAHCAGCIRKDADCVWIYKSYRLFCHISLEKWQSK